MLPRTVYDPIVSDVTQQRREHVQEEFGRHLVEQRNRMAALVRKWIESDAKFPIPIYDRLLDRVRHLDSTTRAEITSIALLMADQVLTGVLMAFDGGDDMRTGEAAINYAVVAQARRVGSDDVVEEIDVNRGKPVIAVWDRYKRWLSRYAPGELRARGGSSDE